MTALRPVPVLFGASLLWGASWLPLKVLSEVGIGGLPLILGAYGLIALLATPLLLRQRPAWNDRYGRRALWLIAGLGGGAQLTFTTALIHGEVVRVMVLFYLLPVWGVLGGRLFLGESVDPWRRLAVVLAVGGAFLILGGPAIAATPPSWIDLVALLSGLLFAMNNLVFRAALAVPVASKLDAMFWGTAGLATLLLLAGGAQSAAVVPAPPVAWYGLALYAVTWLLVANVASQWAVTHLEAGRASIIIIMELVSAVVTATWIGGERMTPLEMAGGALILVAAALEAVRPGEGQAGHPPPVDCPDPSSVPAPGGRALPRCATADRSAPKRGVIPANEYGQEA